MRGGCIVALVLVLIGAGACERDRPRPDPPIAPTPILTDPSPGNPDRVSRHGLPSRRHDHLRELDRGDDGPPDDLPWFLSFDTVAPATFVLCPGGGLEFQHGRGALDRAGLRERRALS